jgi:hypothetical protein
LENSLNIRRLIMLKRNWPLASVIFIVLIGLILISGCRDSRARVPGPGEDNVDPEDVTLTLVGTDIMAYGSEVDDIIEIDSDSPKPFDIELDKCSVLATGEDSQGIKKLWIQLELTFYSCLADSYTIYDAPDLQDITIMYAPVESVTQEGSEGDLVSKTLNCTYDLTKEDLFPAIYDWLRNNLGDLQGVVDCGELYIEGKIEATAEDFCNNTTVRSGLEFRFLTSTREIKTELGV